MKKKLDFATALRELRFKIDKVEKVFLKQSRLTDALEPVKLSQKFFTILN
jgi:hypothetical protein